MFGITILVLVNINFKMAAVGTYCTDDFVLAHLECSSVRAGRQELDDVTLLAEVCGRTASVADLVLKPKCIVIAENVFSRSLSGLLSFSGNVVYQVVHVSYVSACKESFNGGLHVFMYHGSVGLGIHLDACLKRQLILRNEAY